MPFSQLVLTPRSLCLSHLMIASGHARSSLTKSHNLHLETGLEHCFKKESWIWVDGFRPCGLCWLPLRGCRFVLHFLTCWDVCFFLEKLLAKDGGRLCSLAGRSAKAVLMATYTVLSSFIAPAGLSGGVRLDNGFSCGGLGGRAIILFQCLLRAGSSSSSEI